MFVLLSIVVPSVCGAGPVAMKNWYVDTDSDTMYAVTMNDSGSLFGQYCFASTRSCVYLIALGTGCEKGRRYSILANTDVGTSYHEIYCDGELEGGKFRYVFTDFGTIDFLVATAAKVGFAMPLQDDQFKIIRFDLDGGASATGRLKEMANKRLYQRENKPPSEEYL